MYILRPHEIPMLRKVIERGYVTSNVKVSHGNGVAGRIKQLVTIMKANPDEEIKMGIAGNFICGMDCKLLANGNGKLLCESKNASVMELQALWANVGFGYLLGHVFLAKELFNLY